MTSPAISIAPIAAFGDRSAGIWGVIVGGSRPALALGSLADAGELQFTPATLEDAPGDCARAAPGGASTPGWALAAIGHELTVSPLDADAATPALAGELELCQVRGSIRLHDTVHELACSGVRCARQSDAAGSLRLVAAWFGDQLAVALLALRAPNAKGHERDAVSTVVRGEPAGLSVFDPRLSTSYRGDGSPLRMGIELWLGASEDGDWFPRRTTGETSDTYTSATLTRGDARLQAYALRCQSRGLDGAGVYLLAAPNHA